MPPAALPLTASLRTLLSRVGIVASLLPVTQLGRSTLIRSSCRLEYGLHQPVQGIYVFLGCVRSMVLQDLQEGLSSYRQGLLMCRYMLTITTIRFCNPACTYGKQHAPIVPLCHAMLCCAVPCRAVPVPAGNCTGNPTNPANGSFVCAPTPIGGRCNATCALGFFGNPTPSAACNTSAAWNPPTGTCSPSKLPCWWRGKHGCTGWEGRGREHDGCCTQSP